MKTRKPHQNILTTTIAALLLAGTHSHAVSLSWDANGTTAGQTDGAGTWNAANQWWNGATNATWSSATPDDATIGNGGAGGTISLGGNITAGTIGISNFTGTYTLQGTAQTLTTNTGITIGGAGNVTFRGTVATTGLLTMAGAGGITMNGTGILSLRENVTHSYTGDTVINNGVVLLNGAGKSSGNFKLNGGMLTDYFQQTGVFSSGLGMGANQIQIYGASGFGAGNGTSTWRIGAAASTLVWGSSSEGTATGFFNPTVLKLRAPIGDNNGPATFGNPNLDNRLDLNSGSRTFSVHIGSNNIGGSRATIAGGIQDTGGAGSLVKNGGGMLIIGSATSTWGGNTTVNSGILDFGTTNENSVGGGSARNISVAAGAGVKFSALSNAVLNRIVETSAEIMVMTGATANNLDFSSSTGANLPNAFLGNYATNGAKAEYSGTLTPAADAYRLGAIGNSGLLGMTNTAAMTGTQGLIIGAGRVELVGAKAFTGDTVIRDGGGLGLAAFTGGSNALGLQNSVLDTGVTASTGIIWLEATAAGSITGAAATTSATFGGLKGSRALASVYSTTTGANNSAATAVASVTGFTLNTGAGVNVSYSGVIANFATGTTITKTGGGTQLLSGANTFTGALTVAAGTLAVSSVNNVSVAGPLGNSATAVTLGGSGTSGTLQYNGSAATTTKGFTMATSGTGVFDVGNGNQSLTLNAATNATTGSGALSKIGAGGLTFTTAPGHTGGTAVNRGTLLLSGAINMPATGALTVNGGGTFSLGDGTARNTTAASLTLANGSSLRFDWNAAALDNLSSTAAATTSGIVGIQLNNTSPTGTGGTLVTSASGGLDGAAYYLANNSNYTAPLTVSANAVDIGAQTAGTALTSMYWTGNKITGTPTAGVDNALALSNGTSSNWSSTELAYTATGLTPGSTADLFFSNVQADKTQQTAVLGADMTVNSLTIDDSTAVTIGGSSSLKLLTTTTTVGSVDQITGVGTAGAAVTVTSNAASPTIAANVILGGAGQRFIIASGKTLSISGSISGLNGFSTGGAGTLALSGNNFFTGGVTIQGGSTLQIDTGGTYGVGTNSVIFGGSGSTSVGKMTLNTSATAGAITVNSDTATNNTLTIASGQTFKASSLTAGYFLAGSDRNSRLSTAGGGNLILSDVISMNTVGDSSNLASAVVNLSGLGSFRSGSGTGTFTVGAGFNGKGTLTLAATSNIINAATISVGDSANQNYNLADTSTINLGGGTNTLQAGSILLGAGKGAGTIQFAGAGGSVIISGANGIGTATITMNNHSAATNNGQTGSLLLEGHTATVSAGAITIAQKATTATGGAVPGLITFDTGAFSASSIVMANNVGATSATGSITGTFRVGGAAANAGGTGVVNISGDVLLARTTASGAANTSTGTLTINGGTVNLNTAANVSGGIFDATTVGTSTTTINLQGGTLNLNGGVIGGILGTGKQQITNLNFKSGTLQNVFQINDGAGLTKSSDGTGGGGTLILSGANSFTGGVTINAGTVQVGSSGALNATAGSQNAVGFGAATSGTLRLSGNGVTIANLTGSNSGTIVENASATAATLTIGNSVGSSGIYAGTMQNGTGGGALSLTKTGTGILTLSNSSNSYTGATSVAAGTLLVNGAISGSSSVTVAASSILGGTGLISSAVTVNGTLAPGASIESLASGALSMNTGSTLAVELNSSVATSVGADLMKVTGNLSLNGTVNLTLDDIATTDVAFALGTKFSLLNYTGAWNGGLFTVGITELSEGDSFILGLNEWEISYADAEGGLNFTSDYAGGSDSFVNITAVPEPGSALMLIGGLATLVSFRRRRA